MKINRYRGKNLRTAIDKARSDLGPEAKVIHVRQLDVGSPTARKNKEEVGDKIEIIAAIDEEEYEDVRDTDQDFRKSLSKKEREEEATEDNVKRELSAQHTLGQEARTSEVAARQRGARAYATQIVKAADVRVADQDFRESLSKSEGMKEEAKVAALQDSSDSVSSQVYRKLKADKVNNDHILQTLQRCCSKNQVDQNITYEILSLLNDSGGSIASAREQKLERAKVGSSSHWLPKAPRDYMELFMDKQVRVSGGLDMSRKTAIFIGPTGVGKTTTLAKLAAQFRFQYGRSVGLITIDAYRIAAIDQLRTYAQIMSMPLKVALTPEELEQCIREYGDMDVILVDTPGRSPFNTDALHSLQGFLEAAQPADTHLLIALSMKESDAYMVAENFMPQYVRQLIFTKVDETSSFGPILGICKKMEKPVSYLTTGQNVPDDIEAAQVERMVDLFFNV